MTVEQFLVSYDGIYNITVELRARNSSETLTENIIVLLANKRERKFTEWLNVNVSLWTMDDKVLRLYVKK